MALLSQNAPSQNRVRFVVAMATASSRMSKPNVPVLTDGVEQTVPPVQ